MSVEIKKSPNADSRTANGGHVSFEDFALATDMHREDVFNMMNELAGMIIDAGSKHDWTKKERELEFYKSFTAAKEAGKDFKKDDWYKYHTQTERHHLLSHVPKDINLLDILEYISDCCCAGMARSGKVYDLELPDDVLKKAFENTIELVKSKIVVSDE